MRVQIVDPPAYTPPYDHALSAALARRGVEVELVTGRFGYGPTPAAQGYRVTQAFYRQATRSGVPSRMRPVLRLLEHGPDMLRYRRRARHADLVHYQWLPVPPLDVRLLPPARPRVFTAHDVVPREPRPGQVAGLRRLLDKMNAVVVHSEQGAARLRDELGADPERIRVIPHGAFDYLTQVVGEPLPEALQVVSKPVILFFGLLRPYKGVDVLLEAFQAVEGAELWIVGMSRGVPLEPLHDLAARAPGTVRFVPRFVSDVEIPAYFRRADLVVLPYREIDQSGVLYTALAFGKPMVLSAVGGFPEVAEQHGIGRLVPPGDAGALAGALTELLGDERARATLAAAALRAAEGPFSWDAVASQTVSLYEELVRRAGR